MKVLVISWVKGQVNSLPVYIMPHFSLTLPTKYIYVFITDEKNLNSISILFNASCWSLSTVWAFISMLLASVHGTVVNSFKCAINLKPLKSGQ